MVIERDDQGIVIRLNNPVNMKAAQKVIDYYDLIESISRNKGTEEQAAELARESQKEWKEQNRGLFIK
jgi:hypothetical protein